MNTDVFGLFNNHVQNIKSSGTNQWIGNCPFPDHQDRKASFCFNSEHGLYNCKGCGEEGNAIKFAKAMGENPEPYYSEDYKRNNGKSTGKSKTNNTLITYNRLKSDKNGADKQTVNKRAMSDKTDINRHKSNLTQEQLLELIDKHHKEWKDSKYKNLNQVCMSYDRIMFPYFSLENGDVLGIKYHKGDKAPFWKGNGSAKWYNEWHLTHMDKSKPLIITEGEGDCNYMSDLGYNSVSSSNGCLSFPKVDGELYIPKEFSEFPEIIILYDNDKGGFLGSETCAEKIYRSTGTLSYIGQWRKGLPDKYDCSDDKTGKEIEFALQNKIKHSPSIDSSITSITKGVQIMSINSFMESEYEKPEIIVKHFLKSRSTTIIGGCTGVGKSWFSLNLALSISGGLPFMNYFETKKKKVIYAQFELTNGEVQERIEVLKPRYWKEAESIQKNLMIVPKVTSYDEQWKSIEVMVRDKNLEDAVLIVDNLYTSVSTDTDLSNNQDVMRVVKKIDAMAEEYNLHIVVITHHLKHVKDTPITIDNILGGASLTRSASNVFQIKKSRLSNELLVGMITKNRGEQCELLEVPFKLKMVDGYFERGEVISNENIHYIEAKEKWEIELCKKLESYLEHLKVESFDREYLWNFLEDEGWTKNDSSSNKVTRFLSRCVEWGLIEKLEHNKYQIIKGVLD